MEVLIGTNRKYFCVCFEDTLHENFSLFYVNDSVKGNIRNHVD